MSNQVIVGTLMPSVAAIVMYIGFIWSVGPGIIDFKKALKTIKAGRCSKSVKDPVFRVAELFILELLMAATLLHMVSLTARALTGGC